MAQHAGQSGRQTARVITCRVRNEWCRGGIGVNNIGALSVHYKTAAAKSKLTLPGDAHSKLIIRPLRYVKVNLFTELLK